MRICFCTCSFEGFFDSLCICLPWNFEKSHISPCQDVPPARPRGKDPCWLWYLQNEDTAGPVQVKGQEKNQVWQNVNCSGSLRLMHQQTLKATTLPFVHSYVNFLRNMTSTCEPGSRMEAVIRYILQCDQQQAAAPQATRRKRSARRQPNSVSRYGLCYGKVQLYCFNDFYWSI